MRKGLTMAMFVFLATATEPSCAQESVLQDLVREVNALKSRVAALESKVGIQEEIINGQKEELTDYREKFEHIDTHVLHKDEAPSFLGEAGIRMGIGGTMIMQGANNANGTALAGQGEDVTDASYSVDLEFEKRFGDYGSGFLHIETGDGAGVEDELQVFSNVNRDADDSGNALSVTEFFYEQNFTPLDVGIITLGKIDPTVYVDNNEYANDETSQFLGRIFRNNPAIEFPDNSAGMRLGYSPFEWIEFQSLLIDADDDWEDIFNNVFSAGQLAVMPDIFGQHGNYRILGWLNDSPHTKWMDTTETKQTGYGIAISIDQKVTDTIGVFARYGWQNPKVFLAGSDFSLEQSWSTGLQLSGSLWGRGDDVVGLAVGQAIPSDEYKDADSTRNARAETHLELYYGLKLNEHLTISPDLQVILDPCGDDASLGDDPIVVFGTRGQVDF